MNDRNFLSWLHDRLVHVHGENAQLDYMGKLRSIVDALPLDQDTPNTAPDLENLRLATDVMTIDIGATVKAGGRTWIMCAEPLDSVASLSTRSADADYAPTRRVYFIDEASPAAHTDLEPHKDYHLQAWHIRTKERGDAALLSRASWAKQFRAGQYYFDPIVVASDQG